MKVHVRKVIVAWLLLGLMCLVATPRGYLHRCELQHHHADAAGARILPRCTVCDEALPVSEASETLVIRASAPVGLALPQLAVVDPQLGVVLHCSDRGPPDLG